MAKLYPDLDTIHSLKVPPRDGELYLLNYLKDNLNDEYEIYFQPFLNGDRPDIVILRKNAWMIIIEVKDWNLDNYKIEDRNWKVNWAIIKSPLRQVQEYKENIFDLHVPWLLEKKLANPKIFNVIKSMVYFHNQSQKTVDDFLKNEEEIWYKKWFLKALGKEWISLEKFLLWVNPLFDEDIYNYLKRFLQPTFHTAKQWKQINYNKKQLDLIEIKSWQQKIKWVAWSWKTLVLAGRAVEAHKRRWKVLILTFNIALKNYIHDCINDINKDFPRDAFHIFNYHQFIKFEANNLWKRLSLFSFDNEDIFKNVQNDIIKYDAIFIDEIQDYKTSRIRIIKKYFLSEGWEFVVFGDEKQNIYKRPLDAEKLPNTTIPGWWNILTESYRLWDKIAKLAFNFQKSFFATKYNIEDIGIIQENLFLNPKIEHIIFPKNMPINMALDKIYDFINRKNIHPNDICFLSSKVEILREFDYMIRKEKKEKTQTTFETKEIFEKEKDKASLDRILQKIRQNKKVNFWMNTWTIKLSTIHSFKWREIPTVILIINNSDSWSDTDELIYTAITRARENLIIINIENERYTEFFNTYINNAEEKKEDMIKEVKSMPVKKKSKTLDEIDKEGGRMRIKSIVSCLKSNKNKPYKICILWETVDNKDSIKKEIGWYFAYNNLWYSDWDVEFIDNKKIKSNDVLKQFKKWRSSVDLIITWQIHSHSSKWNESCNILTELWKDLYVPHISWNPKKEITTKEIVSLLDSYLQEQYRLTFS